LQSRGRAARYGAQRGAGRGAHRRELAQRGEREGDDRVVELLCLLRQRGLGAIFAVVPRRLLPGHAQRRARRACRGQRRALREGARAASGARGGARRWRGAVRCGRRGAHLQQQWAACPQARAQRRCWCERPHHRRERHGGHHQQGARHRAGATARCCCPSIRTSVRSPPLRVAPAIEPPASRMPDTARIGWPHRMRCTSSSHCPTRPTTSWQGCCRARLVERLGVNNHAQQLGGLFWSLADGPYANWHGFCSTACCAGGRAAGRPAPPSGVRPPSRIPPQRCPSQPL